MPAGPALALAAAVLFGLSAPAAKFLIGLTDPWMLAGLLYVGSGLGLGAGWLGRRLIGRPGGDTPLRGRDLPWLAGAILCGGGIAPVLLVLGLARTSASQTALLLNVEGVLTALLAWVVFREHVNARIAIGMATIALGALVLAWNPAGGAGIDAAALLVVGACLAWAIDNNLTRRISGSDPVQIAALKGLVAGPVNVLLAGALGAPMPGVQAALGAGVVGFFGYGASLALFVLALRHLGTGRTAAYFSTAPFIGAVGGVLALREPLTIPLGAAGLLMAIGVGLHLTERHAHEHTHEPLEHEHLHWHDAHHQHEHPPDAPPGEPHTHPHLHGPLRHRHPHYPDLHHRHGH